MQDLQETSHLRRNDFLNLFRIQRLISQYNLPQFRSESVFKRPNFNEIFGLTTSFSERQM